MELLVSHGQLSVAEVDALVVYAFDTQSDRFAKMSDQPFSGKTLETVTIHRPDGYAAKFMVVVGLGSKQDFTPVVARQAAAQGIQAARSLKALIIAAALPGLDDRLISGRRVGEAVAEGAMLGNYRFTRYKTVENEKIVQETIETYCVIVPADQSLEEVRLGVARGEAIATAILNARDIINEPPSKIKPSHLAKAAQEIAGLSKTIKATILDEAALKKEGYAALLAVASGSEEKPYLIHLHYRPNYAKHSVAFVGKGVTFDTGGLGIKPWSAMLSMKADMAGGAAVLGIFQALAELESLGMPLTVEVHGVVAATENMISGKAMRPDDIIETKHGKTIEVLHTDAEGRLILADGLTYATTFKPEQIIDFATLTGAAIKALGSGYAARMGNDRELLQRIEEAGQETGELTWELPLPDFYKKQLQSPVADLQNISLSDDSPGAIFGGLFLQEFVGDTPWAHLDIAGPAYTKSTDNPLTAPGGTGYGILLGLKLLEKLDH